MPQWRKKIEVTTGQRPGPPGRGSGSPWLGLVEEGVGEVPAARPVLPGSRETASSSHCPATCAQPPPQPQATQTLHSPSGPPSCSLDLIRTQRGAVTLRLPSRRLHRRGNKARQPLSESLFLRRLRCSRLQLKIGNDWNPGPSSGLVSEAKSEAPQVPHGPAWAAAEETPQLGCRLFG